MQRDNTTLRQKVALRRRVLAEIPEPVVLETHAGQGLIYRACYAMLPRGVALDKDERRAELLAAQRPTWAVYCADAQTALEGGVGAHLPINLVDLDPFGEPWPTIRAFFGSERPRSDRLWLVVNDGLRQKVQLGGAWRVASLQAAVARHGNNLWDRYLEVCRELVEQEAGQAGYRLAGFDGYYCGTRQHMTHYAAALTRSGADS